MTPDEREKGLLRLCDDALAKDASDRAAFLDEACGGDPALREEVESLLAGRAAAEGFLEPPGWAPGTPPLTAGTRLGPYEIQSFIGAGGMGQVYKARDTRLGRTVAIKVLPPELAAHSERRRRFEQEARAASALNDPHICTLHDIGSDNGTDYLVMEYLEGETLAARLRKGCLPLDQALAYATQIAEALSKAHRQGIIHRDLKPGNVMLTKAGAKLVDFGLAKLRAPVGAAVSATFSTREKSITAEGTLLGTVPYMAPEQLEGKEADARSDLFSLGTVLYEMVTGKRAFEGESHASVVAAILEHEPPPLSAIQPLTPPALDRLVRRCLAKSPDDRPDTAHDVAEDLRWLREPSGVVPSTAARSSRRRLAQATLTAVAVLVVIVGVAAVWVLRQKALSPTRVCAMIPLTTEQVTTFGHFANFAISPDGEFLVFKEGDGLVRRPIDAFTSTPIDGTRGATRPVFKPDGTALAFVAGGRLKFVPSSGGSPADVAGGVGSGPGIFWGEDDLIYFSADLGGGIWRVTPGGGSPKVVTQVREAKNETAHAWPQLLPGGTALLFTALGPSGGSSDSRVVVEEIATHRRRMQVDNAISGRYVKSGHLIFGRSDGTVYAAPFDLPHLYLSGDPRPVLSPVGTGTWGAACFWLCPRTALLRSCDPANGLSL